MLLIHPPIAKNCEPPGGLPRLAGALRGHGYHCSVLDASHEALLYLLDYQLQHEAEDTWSRRAIKNRERNINNLTDWTTYKNRDRYQKCVGELNRILELASPPHQLSISLTNYVDQKLSPLKSSDLIRAASAFEANIFFPYFSSRLTHILEKEHHEMVGISLNYLSQALSTFAMIGFLKHRFPELTVILGGGLVTSWLRNPQWSNPFTDLIDHLISGPGEKALLQLLGWKEEIHHYPPDFSDVTSLAYFSPGFILPYASSSGCYWNKCSFCPEKAEDNPYLPTSTGQVLADLNHLVDTTQPTLLHFLDNAIPVPLLDRLIAQPRRANWYGFARFNKRLANLDYCIALKKSGCVMLKLGLESGNQGVLDSMSKGIKLDMVVKALHNLKQAGIATYVYLLFGTPAETIDKARKTMDFITTHSDTITYLNLAIFNLPVNSAETSSLALRSFYEGDLSLYCDFAHPKNFNRKEVRRFLDQEFKRQPKIATILQRDPPLFTSNHAPFFHIDHMSDFS